MRPLVRQTVEAIAAGPNRPTGLDSRHAAALLVGGILRVLSEWLHDPLPIDPYQLADQIADLLPSWVADGTEQIPSCTSTSANHSHASTGLPVPFPRPL